MKVYIAKKNLSFVLSNEKTVVISTNDILGIDDSNNIKNLTNNNSYVPSFINLDNLEYFVPYYNDILPNTYAWYKGKLVFVKNISEKHAETTFNNRITTVKLSELTAPVIYYFISSKGKIQNDILNKDSTVDTFRMKQNNYFVNKDSAQKILDDIWNK